jgi:hypothetical protein
MGGRKMNVLVACEYSGIVRDAFLRAGHNAYSVDLLPTESEYPNKTSSRLRHYQGDIFTFIESCSIEWDLLIAHPPCTHLSVSGARWFPPHTKEGEAGFKPLHLRFEALAFVDKLMRLDIPRICIENPRAVISSFIRKSDQTIQPYQFGHAESKTTCLWLKNLPQLIETDNVYEYMMTLPIKVRNRIHWLGSGKGKERSKFYEGIAEAMAKQWGILE